ncbi:MAG: DNA photolyase family protein [Chitinophagales bacterium]|nr:DNA photolyase family protein [Chitinophagales bacterium]MDW8419830.1 deoxyribodipyrimidine photo-lyase [Chitinophagales bacterium]
MPGKPIAIFWFRRDLRLDDNAGLYHALRSGLPVLPIFIFDTDILDKLEDKTDKRVLFIHREICHLRDELVKLGSTLRVYYGKPIEVWRDILDEYEVRQVFTNHDYEPYARERDGEVERMLISRGISFHSSKDHVIFEKDEVLKDDGSPYTVFTPYSRKWREKLNDFYTKSYPTLKYAGAFWRTTAPPVPSLQSMGFIETAFEFPPRVAKREIIAQYTKNRNYPGIDSTSRLGIHLRFGTLSIRKLLRFALSIDQTFVNELIWRDFYQQILWHFPHVVNRAFKPEYDRIKWENNPEHFKAWCEGRTGYPLVDAGMRELNTTGFMHNRVRMVAASFLTKHLLIDWRWGEAYFAAKLLDFDLAANNGGWQWSAGCGTDAAPYFRIFNPITQAEKFDPQGHYIRKWIPELGTPQYPKPIVDHHLARERCIRAYKIAIES